MDIRRFQKNYALSNKEMARICQCSLPTIQKWRSGEVRPSGAARQLVQLLDFSAKGDPAKLRNVLARMNQAIESVPVKPNEEIELLESSMTKVMNRLELMLETRRKERALAESEARYRSMVESREDPVCRWKPDTTLTYVNEAYSQLFSEFGTDLIGRKWLDFIPPEKRASLETIVSDIVRRGEPEVYTHESIDKDGQIRFQEWRDIPIRNERGTVVELHSVGRDKTEIVRARKRIQELQALVDSLMQACENPVTLFQGDGKLIQWNDAFKEQMLRNRKRMYLGDLFPALEKKRFNRLLERLSDTGHVVYRVQFNDEPMLLTVWMVRVPDGPPQFLGSFKGIAKLLHGRVQQVRLSGEVLIDDRPVETDLGASKKAKINKEVEAIAKLSQVDRIYVFLFDDENEVMNNLIEWCAEGVEAHIDELQRIPFQEYSWWIGKLKKKQWINVSDVDQLPRTATQERDILKAQDIASVVVAPLLVGRKVAGFVGFDQNTKPRLWHSQEIELLKRLKEKTEAHLAGSGKARSGK